MPTDPELIATIGSLVEAAYPADEPGAAVIVVRAGEVIYRAARGMANLELGVPLAPDMVLRIGSITKQFTAVAILILAERSLLAVDDPITKYLPDYPTQGHAITVEHLLTHTSGIKSYTSMPEWPPLWRKDFTLVELIDFFKDQPMDFAPGERMAYSNSGYILLGAIIEKASGQTYEAFIQQHIFDALGMAHACYDSPTRVIPRRAAGYDKGPEGYTNAPYLSMTQPYAAGSLAASVDDLALWDTALYTDRLLKPETLRKAHVGRSLADGSASDYGYGWVVGQLAGQEAIVHNGGIPGFLSMALRLPAQRVYVAALSNNTSVDPMQLAVKIAAETLGQPLVEPTPIELSPELLMPYEGLYRVDKIAQIRLALKDGRLGVQWVINSVEQGPPLELVPFAAHMFFIKDHSLDKVMFASGAEGVITGFEIHWVIGQPLKATKIDAA